MSNDAPTEPRDSEPGQEQATDTEDESMAEAEAERDSRTEHPDTESGGTHGLVEPVATRETAPMSEFTGRDVGIGIAVLLVGLLITVAVPLVFTLG
jgi:hypothetical protein